MATKGNLRSTVSQQIVLASLSRTPSVLAGYFAFEIGNGFSQIVPMPASGFDAHGVSSVSFPTTPAFKGLTAYFESAYLDFTASAVWPMPSSNVWSTTYK